MKPIHKTVVCLLVTSFFITSFWAQGPSTDLRGNDDKKISLKFGVGYFQAFLSDEGVSYDNATYDPNVGAGVSYFLGFDYNITEDIAIGIGYNGTYGKADFIRNAVVDSQTINGYLEAGAVTNTHILLNVSYTPVGSGIKPYGKLGFGYLIQQVELGDVPLNLTNNVETEIFPDYKSKGLGIMPELGVRYGDFFLSAAYGFSLEKLTGEDNPDGFVSTGSLTSQSLQINLSYRIFLF